jgi:hypothetical protein
MHIAQLSKDYTDVGKEYIRTMVRPSKSAYACHTTALVQACTVPLMLPPICAPKLGKARVSKGQ